MEHALTNFRLKNGLSRARVAEMTRTSRQTIYRIEKGDQTPSLDLMERIRAATGGEVTPNDFLPPMPQSEGAAA